ncbi:MAG: glycosyltransferase family 4 protein [Lentisphaeria bacterium]|nr:glycosyltransferase family 4 protein [Lentisphaeria bacterium]
MRALFIDTSPFTGGAQRSLFGLLSELKRDSAYGIDPYLLTADDSDAGLATQARSMGIDTGMIPTRNWPRTWRGLLAAWADTRNTKPILGDWLDTRDIDLVYANGIRSGLLCTLGLPSKVPLIFHHRDLRSPQKVLKQVVTRAVQTITISNFQRGQYPTELQEKMTTVRNGFDWPDIRVQAEAFDASQEFELPDGPCVVLIADMVEWKRHAMFLEAAAGQPFTALVVGGARDDDGRRYEEQLWQQAPDNVRFLGSQPNPYPVIREADVLVSVADGEPFGRTVVEAFGLGTPVVIAGGGGPEETMGGRAGAAIVEGQPAAIANAVGQTLAEPPEMTEAMAYAETFSLPRHAGEISAILTSHPTDK